MEIQLLGQAGLQITLNDHTMIVVDPYLSDTLHETKGEKFARRVPAMDAPERLTPDVIAITHDHGDHLDMASVSPWLDRNVSLQVLGPYPVFRAIAGKWPAKHNVMVMRPGVEATMGSVTICAVPASHETPDAVGYLIRAEGRTIYVSGDTLYTREIPHFLKGETIDLAFVCINGFGNNMNCADAARLMNQLKPALVVPVHWDMFGPFGADPMKFVPLLDGIPYRVMNAYETIEI